MKFNKDDINLLASFVKRNILSVNEVNDWCYAQFTEQGAPEWIEKMALATDRQEVLDIITSNFGVYGELNFEYQAGEISYEYKNGLLILHQAIYMLLYDVYPDDEELKSEKTKLYIAEDYYDWHDHPDIVAKKEAQPIFDKYYSKYAKSRKLFNVKHIDTAHITMAYNGLS